MKILLIAPYVVLKYDLKIEKLNRTDFIPSAALMYLAAVLRANNYEPTILDFNNTVVDSHKEKYLDSIKNNKGPVAQLVRAVHS